MPKWLIGGIGGLAPVIANLLLVDADAIGSYLQNFFGPGWLLLIGYIIRCLLLFAVGAFWAAVLHAPEGEPLKIFQLGIVAPALLVGAINATELDDTRAITRDAVRSSQSTNGEFIAPVYAKQPQTSFLMAAAAAEVSPEAGSSSQSGEILDTLIDGALGRPIQADLNVPPTTDPFISGALGRLVPNDAIILRDVVAEQRMRLASLQETTRDLQREIAILLPQIIPPSQREQALQRQLDALETARREAVTLAEQRQRDLEQTVREMSALQTEVSAIRKALEVEISKWQSTSDVLLFRLANERVLPVAVGYGGFSVFAAERDDLDRALEYYRKLAGLAEDLEYSGGKAIAYENLGMVSALRDDMENGREYSQLAMSLSKELGRSGELVTAYDNLGLTAQLRDGLDQAEKFHQEALKLASDLGYSWGEASARLDLGVIWAIRAERGDVSGLGRAEKLFEEARQIFQDQKATGSLATAYHNLGVTAGIRGDLPKAREYFELAVQLVQARGG